jgi:hypothetical protein
MKTYGEIKAEAGRVLESLVNEAAVAGERMSAESHAAELALIGHALGLADEDCDVAGILEAVRCPALQTIGAACDLLPAERTVAGIVAVVERLVAEAQAYRRGQAVERGFHPGTVYPDIGLTIATYPADPPPPRIGMIAESPNGRQLVTHETGANWFAAHNVTRITDLVSGAVLWERA